MKTNSLLAFILTLVALTMILGLLGCLVYNNLSKFVSKEPDYCESFSVDLKPETYSAFLEIGKGELIKVNVTNNGFEEEFRIGFEGPKWVATRPLEMRLDQGGSEDVFVYLSPTGGSEGSYTLTVFVESYCGREETEIMVKV